MVVVSRNAKSYIPCWLISSDLFPNATLPMDMVNSTWRDASGSVGPITASLDRSYGSFTYIGGSSFQFWNFRLATGNNLMGCDQIAIIGEKPVRAPIPFTLIAQGIPFNIQFAITDISLNRNSGADFYTIDHDRLYPTTGFSFNTAANSSNMRIRDILPLGGNRYYTKIYRNAARTAFFSDIRGHVPIPTIPQNCIVCDSMILPSLDHTVSQIDQTTWTATINIPAALVPKTSPYLYEPGGSTLTLAEHASVKAKWPLINMFYWLKIASEPPCLLYTTNDGWYVIASSLNTGAVGVLTPSSLVFVSSNKILPASTLAALNPTEVRITNVVPTPSASIRSTSQLVIDRLKANRSLTLLAGEQSLWINDTPTLWNGDIINPPDDKALTNSVYHSAGNVNGIHWVPDVVGSSSKFATGKQQMNILVKL